MNPPLEKWGFGNFLVVWRFFARSDPLMIHCAPLGFNSLQTPAACGNIRELRRYIPDKKQDCDFDQMQRVSPALRDSELAS
jgi:hypothetical protein